LSRDRERLEELHALRQKTEASSVAGLRLATSDAAAITMPDRRALMAAWSMANLRECGAKFPQQ